MYSFLRRVILSFAYSNIQICIESEGLWTALRTMIICNYVTGTADPVCNGLPGYNSATNMPQVFELLRKGDRVMFIVMFRMQMIGMQMD